MSNKLAKIIMSLIVAALFAIFMIGVNFATPKTPGQRIGTEAVRILEQYKSNALDAETTNKIITGLMAKIMELEETETDSAKRQNLAVLWLNLLNISNKLEVNGTATTSEIDEAEERIRNSL